MHESQWYGKILLEQKYQQTFQQTSQQNSNICSDVVGMFANKLLRHLPFTLLEIQVSLCQLIENKVLYIDGEFLCQKRMIKDGSTSQSRSLAGKSSAAKGGGLKNFVGTKSPTKSQQQQQQTSVSVSVSKEEIDNKGVSNNTSGGVGVKNFGGEEEREGIDHYIGNWHLTTNPEDCKKYYFTHTYFQTAKQSSLSVLFTYFKADDQEILTERLQLWADEFNQLLHRTNPENAMKGAGCWPDHFYNWLRKQGAKLKEKPNGRLKELDNQNGSAKKVGGIPSLENGATMEELEEYYTYKPKLNKKQ